MDILIAAGVIVVLYVLLGPHTRSKKKDSKGDGKFDQKKGGGDSK